MALLSQASVISLALGAVLLVTLAAVGQTIYNIFLHPLRSFPGPFLWRASTLARVFYQIKGILPHKVLELHTEYGPIVRISPNELAFSDAQAWQDIYGFRKRGEEEMGKWWGVTRFLGKEEPPSVITADRAEHAAVRRLLSHGFSDRALRDQEPMIGSYVDLLIRRISEKARGGPASFDMQDWYNFTTFDIIGDLSLGSSFGCLASSDYHPWVKMISPAFTALVMLWQLNYLGLNRVIRLIQRLGGVQIRNEHEKIVAAKVSERIELGPQRPDLMQGLIGDREKTGLDFGRLVMNASILIIAGSETTATLLAAVTYYLTMHPELLAKATKEVRDTFQADADITLLSVQRLPYMLACLDEAMRCFPPAPGGFPREVPKGGATVAGRYVPEKTIVTIVQWAINRDAKYWNEPEKFDPERFLGGKQYESDRLDAMQPFSFGPRNCLGKNLAYAEMRLILAKVLWHFDMAIEDDSRDWVKRSGAFAVWEKPSLNIRFQIVARP